jgi:serine/threonine-protein kinase
MPHMNGTQTARNIRVAVVATLAVALSIIAASPARADGPADEAQFITEVRTKLPNTAIPKGRYATDQEVLAYGYEACAAMDRYPDDGVQAARVFYGYPPNQIIEDDQMLFMLYAGLYLCNRHSEY